MGHQHGLGLSMDNQLSSIFEKGLNSSINGKHDHKNGSQSESEEDDDEIDPRTGKKKIKKR